MFTSQHKLIPHKSVQICFGAHTTAVRCPLWTDLDIIGGRPPDQAFLPCGASENSQRLYTMSTQKKAKKADTSSAGSCSRDMGLMLV